MSAKESKLPNFFVLGAEKSGTTTVDNLLEQHPNVFLPATKEPNFIISQFLEFPFCGPLDEHCEMYRIKNSDEYYNLYKNANTEKAIGDASTSNLYYHEGAIPIIKEYCGNSKMIIIIRNPVDRAFSAYKHLCRDMRESLSFEEALRKEEERIHANWSMIWHYKKVGLYSQQVEAYLKAFDKVKVFLFEDLKESPLKTIKEIYQFLEVDESFVPTLHQNSNISGMPKNRFFQWLFFKPGNFKGTIFKQFSKILPPRKIYAVFEKMRSKNLQQIEMSPETRFLLQDYFRDDIKNLERIIGKDLSKWYTAEHEI